MTTGNASKWDLWTILLDGAGIRAREPEAFQRTEADERESDFSPDGRWVTYAASEAGGRFDIYVRAFPDDGRRWKVSDGGGVYPRWSASRSTLLLRRQWPVDGGALLRQRRRIRPRQAARVVAATACRGARTESLPLFGLCGRHVASSRWCPTTRRNSTRDGTSRCGSTP